MKIGHDPTHVAVLALSTITLNSLEDYETTIQWAQQSIELGEGHGFHNHEAEARVNLGWARVALGDPSGLEEAEAGLARALDSGFRGGMCQFLIAAANANLLAENFARAHELLDRAQQTYEATGEGICFEGRTRRVRATAFFAEGALPEAEAEFLRALKILERYGARLECLMARTTLLRIARGRDDQATARERLALCHAQFEDGHEYAPLRAARALLDEVS